ncbi:MAG: radical SAM protein [Candidatus Omnitrophica bacterium]|jgi:radical SAM protein with 4Fe4S-binding SPASM domain|nr:radical SAM protein [Candidatus Omnitrophota bacterium]MDD5660480.1 radical SAM protein [Candidatus Omnitrophota bacterium]
MMQEEEMFIPPDVAWRPVGDRLVVIKIASGQHPEHTITELNREAALIWKFFSETGLSHGRLIAKLMPHYNINRSSMASDISAFLNKAIAKGLLQKTTKKKSFRDGRLASQDFPVWTEYFSYCFKNLIPYSATLELNTTCNQRCLHCYNNGHGEAGLSAKLVYSALDQLSDLGTIILLLSGGEPLMRKDFFKLAAYARQRHFALRIFTNATLIDEESAKKISQLYPMTVETSLYGISSRVHERITQRKGSFMRTIKAIRFLKKYQVPVFVKVVLMRENAVEIKRLEDFVVNILGVGFRGVSPIITPKTSGNFLPMKHVVSRNMLKEYLNSLRYTASGLKAKPMVDKSSNKAINKGRLCGSGRTTIYINAKGRLSPCLEAETTSWNIKKDRIRDFWQNSSELAALRSLSPEALVQCKACPDKEFCIFSCIALSKKIYGDYAVPIKKYCEFTKVYRASSVASRVDQKRQFI